MRPKKGFKAPKMNVTGNWARRLSIGGDTKKKSKLDVGRFNAPRLGINYLNEDRKNSLASKYGKPKRRVGLTKEKSAR